jgi:hypothetical protein
MAPAAMAPRDQFAHDDLRSVFVALAPSASWLSGVILLLGCLGVLVANVLTGKRG